MTKNLKHSSLEDFLLSAPRRAMWSTATISLARQQSSTTNNVMPASARVVARSRAPTPIGAPAKTRRGSRPDRPVRTGRSNGRQSTSVTMHNADGQTDPRPLARADDDLPAVMCPAAAHFDRLLPRWRSCSRTAAVRSARGLSATRATPAGLSGCFTMTPPLGGRRRPSSGRASRSRLAA